MKPSRKMIDEVQGFLDDWSAAITSGDGHAAAEFWDVPALVLGDDMARPVASATEIEKFFGGAREQYNAKDITGTRAVILGLEELTPKIALVTVRFPWIDSKGDEKGGETSTYTLHRDAAGALRIRGAVMHGAEN
ncbi:hypothetical protein [Usitatibacter palustris]|uniref:SnoaL-like domain-containing protein n=1 Tax=Usitatibacter palustris TaxID=2732487 RepID=A0A6M4HBM2_9PROT|nr:hypothetical protein [Usitatibacter palustris]QJR15884.1 hypothetical protein DSM104440_02710 [Usitatibacter palustris]